jgi:hypothetical protein
MGYGLDNVKTDKDGLICDPRFNESVVNGRDVGLDWKEFLKYLKSQNKPYRALCYYWLHQKESLNLDFHWGLHDTFIHESEFGLPGVFLVMPIEMTKEWSHHDDSIDYYEAVSRSDNSGCAPRILKLDRPLYPFEGYMDARTGESIQNGASIFSTYKYLVDNNSDKKIIDDYCKTHFACVNEDEFKANFVPYVPEGVVAQCHFANIFVDEKTILELRPMIYEFWS